MFFAFICFMAFTSCKKETNTITDDVVHFSASDFQSGASNSNASRNNIQNSNLKIAIKPIANKKNTYRLALRIDSILITEKGDSKMIPLPENTKLIAGLSIPNTEDPKATIVIFEKNALTFRKQNENGFSVFVSDPFTTDFNFDYELVEIQLGGEVPNMVITLAESHSFLILPNGSTVIQAPEVEKINTQGKWKHSSGKDYASTVVFTIANDPAQEIKSLVYVPDLVKVATDNPKEPVKYIELPWVELDKTYFNQNNGVARYSSSRWEETYGFGKSPNEWSGSGTIYAKAGNPVVVAFKDPILKYNPTPLKGSSTR